jgi:hypothetical protein
MATITGDRLELTVADLSGQNSKLTLPLKHRAQQSQLDNPADRWRVYNCSLFFNSTSGLVAVGITTESEPPQRLQVAHPFRRPRGPASGGTGCFFPLS